MNVEWIIGGVLVLFFAVSLKLMLDKCAFRGLIWGFTIIWAALAAMHFWGVGLEGVRYAFASVLSEAQQTLAAYWCVFLLAALPGALLVWLWLKSYETTFPPLADSCIQWLCAFLTAGGLTLLILMNVALCSPAMAEDFPQSPVGRAYLFASRLPVQTYLQLAGGTEREQLDRLPRMASALVRPYSGR